VAGAADGAGGFVGGEAGGAGGVAAQTLPFCGVGVLAVGTHGETAEVVEEEVLRAGVRGAVLGRARARHAERAAGLAEVGPRHGDELPVGARGVADGLPDPFVVHSCGVVPAGRAGVQPRPKTRSTPRLARITSVSRTIPPISFWTIHEALVIMEIQIIPLRGKPT
jgi:hypothetical protein